MQDLERDRFLPDNRRSRSKYEKRVYQYATGRGGVPLGGGHERRNPQNFSYPEDEDRVYQYATGRGGVRLTQDERDFYEQQNARMNRVGPHFGKGPRGYTRSDERIREEVCDALYRSYDVDASGIEVEVKDGCVFLRGTVDTRQTKRMAEDAVENISGVRDVQNELRFNRNGPVMNRSDSEPTDEAGTRLS